MSFQTFHKEPRLEQWVMNTKGTLYIAESLMNEIEYLHRQVGSLEWCGPLIYEKLEGKLTDPETLKIRAHHVFPMDIGSGAHTSASFAAEDIVDLYDEYPGLMDGSRKQGLIHTHHTMSTFFSGTDMDELHDNTPNHLYYLSLIVNFDGKWMAKVAFIATVNEKTNKVFTYKDTDDEEASFDNSDESEKKVLMMIDMNIIKEGSDTLSQSFKERFLKLQEDKKKASTYKGGVTVYGPNGSVSIKSDTEGRAPGYTEGVTPGGGGGSSYKGKSSMEQGDLWQDIQEGIQERKEKESQGGSTGNFQDGWGQDTWSWADVEEEGWELLASGRAGYNPNKEAEEGSKKTSGSNGNRKKALGKKDRMTESEARDLVLEWLNAGCLDEMQIPKSKFSLTLHGLSFFEDIFHNSFDHENYSYWKETMAKALYEIAYEYVPAVVSVRISRVLEGPKLNYRVACDLFKIANDYEEYYEKMRELRKVSNY